MPRLNRQGPLGNGPLTGRQRGMCKRTEEFASAGGGFGRGRGVGSQFRSADQPGGGIARLGRRFSQGAESTGGHSLETRDEELAELKKQYQEARATLTGIAKRIESLEAKAARM